MKENGATSNPHQLLTRKKLEEAVMADLGHEWKLIDFEIKDFTKKGDNYSCVVTGVSCRAIFDGEEKTMFYVAKLNPLREMSVNDSLASEMFEKEGKFLTTVAPKLNQILHNIKYPKINFPECVYSTYKIGEEVLLLKDLRLKGFQMFDKRIGMDFEHSKLLIKELAKLHASSFILKRNLDKQTILDIYPHMTDKWLNQEENTREFFGLFIKNNIDISLKMIKPLKVYEKQHNWLKKIKNNSIDMYVDNLKISPENMKVICHGDCWNNNVLFRYDEKENPIEVTLLDLQMCRFGSLALDLNYFFYTSLTGDIRNKYFDQLLSEYYEEFRNVLNSNNMDMPFSKVEMLIEVSDKTIFGILNAIIILPLIICESEDAPDMSKVKDDELGEFLQGFTDSIMKLSKTSPVFKSRFMAIFDDISRSGLLEKEIVIYSSAAEENDKISNPHKLLTKQFLEEALKADLGDEWKLIDFEIKDFTKKGNNYACIVTGVSCRAIFDGEEKTMFYVAKLNPLCAMSSNDSLASEMFEKEGKFLTTVAPKLNQILHNINYPKVNFPESVYSTYKRGGEVFLLRDLRCNGFKMVDKRIGVDFEHSKLLIKELAKLHASSVILKSSLVNQTILDIYPYMTERFLNEGNSGRELFGNIFESNIDITIKMIKPLKNYEKQCNWLQTKISGNSIDIYTNLLRTSPENMKVINHGDGCNNNVLFRYDERENPIEVTLLDFQMCRFGSLALDLNYFFYTSLTGDTRNKYFDQLLSEYYKQFRNVLNSKNMVMPFTEVELRKEVLDKTIFGVLSGIMILPFIICESEDAPDLSKIKKNDDLDEFIQDFTDSIIKLSTTSSVFKSRLLTIFDDISRKGLMEKEVFIDSSSAFKENEQQSNPNQIIERKQVENAVKSDLGENWNLIDYEIKDFTKKGDNYATIVTGLSCRAMLEDGKEEKTVKYIVKKTALDHVFKEEMTNEIFIKEAMFLSDVAPTLNQILMNKGSPKNNFPECVYYDLKMGSEMIILKDLRSNGFKMLDKSIGMDFKHSQLAVKALAKFHASSSIFKNTLENKTVLDIYPFMYDKYLEPGNDGREMMKGFLIGNIDFSLKCIQGNSKYKRQYNWLENLKKNVINIFCNLIKDSPENMRVICHGDCWNNNMMFRYDDQGIPLEVTLLDLQICKIGSIGLDLNYFLYSSFTGVSRKNHFEQLLVEYYTEFESVFNSAKMQMPFTFQKFRKEILDKSLFGIICGVMILPFVALEGEKTIDLSQINDGHIDEYLKDFAASFPNLSEISPVLNDRLFSILDDMITLGIMEENNDNNSSSVQENKDNPNPHELITRERLEEALKSDLGQNWKFIDFQIQDFTKKGDNYACLVTGISCRAKFDIEKTVYYVAKLNPLRPMSLNNAITTELFTREGMFLTEVAPALNKIMRSINYSELNVPECVYANLQEGEEILLLKDLRVKGFKMIDKYLGMDLEHSTLVVKELAKLHASSVIFKSTLENQTVFDIYPFMSDHWLDDGNPLREMFSGLLENRVNLALKMIRHFKEYENQYNWLNKNAKGKAIDIYVDSIKDSPENMKVICHGDCWNNNVLFRYNEMGSPQEITLLDLQICRFGSVGLDLNNFFYTSLTGDTRKKHLNQLVNEYYKEFEKVMKSASFKMPFTQNELKKEILNKAFFGILNAFIALPLIICESDNAPDFFNSTDEDREECLKDFTEYIMKFSETSPIFNTRFMSLFDDILKLDVMKNDYKFKTISK